MTPRLLWVLVLAGCGPRSIDVSGTVRTLPDFPRVKCASSDAPASDRVQPGTRMTDAVQTAFAQATAEVADAMLAREEQRLVETECGKRAALGAWLGVPDAVATYTRTPTPVSDAVATQAIERAVRGQLGRESWQGATSTSGVDVHEPLRSRCTLMRAEALAMVLLPERAKEISQSLRPGLDWLLGVQRADGLFPFPDLEDEFAVARAKCDAAVGPARTDCEKALAGDPARLVSRTKADLAARGEQVSDYFVDGWLVRDTAPKGNDGGLQFDHGVCGETMLVAGLVLQDERLLAAARRAAQWARTQALAPNWNYNAFSVRLLSLVASLDDDPGLGAAAVDKAWWGVLPGQLANGRWSDGHNARVVYHVIMMASLVPARRLVEPERASAFESALAASVLSYTEEVRAAQGTAGDEAALQAFSWLSLTRALTEDEESMRSALFSTAVQSDSVRNVAALDALLARSGRHPFAALLR